MPPKQHVWETTSSAMISPIAHLHLGTAVNRPGAAKGRNKISIAYTKCSTLGLGRANTWERAAMVETVRAYARSEAGVLGPQGISETVLQAMGQTERHRFTPGRSCSLAYMDGPVLIGEGQTISQP